MKLLIYQFFCFGGGGGGKFCRQTAAKSGQRFELEGPVTRLFPLLQTSTDTASCMQLPLPYFVLISQARERARRVLVQGDFLARLRSPRNEGLHGKIQFIPGWGGAARPLKPIPCLKQIS